MRGAGDSESALLAAAREGDEDAFRTLVERHARSVHLHCYRMLGSIHDADDGLQETFLRAWRQLGSFQERSSLKTWLHKVATNVCLTFLSREPRRTPPTDASVLATRRPPPGTPVEPVALEPYPDRLLAELEQDELNPATRYELRESVQLAFLGAVKLLPPRERAVLVLRDVLGFSGREVAHTLETSVAAINSALQRARARLEAQAAAGRLSTNRVVPSTEVEQSLVRRYMTAWEAIDIEGLVALLKEDALLTMPPFPMSYRGRSAIAAFLSTVPAGGALDRIRLLPTRANLQPALAAYVEDPESGRHQAYGLMVLTLDGDEIAEITGFSDPSLFAYFELPDSLDS